MGMLIRIALIKESEDMARTAEDLGDCQGFKAGAAAPVRLLDAGVPRVAIVDKSP